ncbi:TPA: hypothetical protein P1M42_000098 [Clostridioides difficile]|uniref:Uncharacterized protein n=2 Tax=Clostridioides difficile TaxID=1496 RepID=A0ACA7UNZ3_CLODI|nr:hypothetical protein [Clostridioides difficile]YP_009221702.1 hypothetical protein PHICD211_20101 [Clostridium phage phiCD211]AKP44779.1 hypothetical protein CDIF1296T_phi105 [Peptoclostridium phage phiCDIF1296T]OFU34245.1 hypothetical protein HMPREF3076_00275 [Clostridium sp. HMSC19B12]WMU95202.1 hypothetical protein ADOKEBJH_00106 [Clostridioides phage AR1086-1]CCL67061.1 hypothetical protein BN183_3830004 [Clostridioides difficile E7]ARC16974.1 hypothetical protein A6J95_19640 [Clostrid
MGLDLGFYSVKTKVTDLDIYLNKTRGEKYKELNNDEEEFYKFEELLDIDISLEDWSVIRMIYKAKWEKGYESYEDEAILITKEDLEDYIIPFLKQKDINSKIYNKDKEYYYKNDKKVTVDDRYTQEFWDLVLKEFQKMLNIIDFEKHSLIIMYWY